MKMLQSVATSIVPIFTSSENSEDWDYEGIQREAFRIFNITELDTVKNKSTSKEEITEEILEKAYKLYEEKEQQIGSDDLREVERRLLLKTVDEKWMDHIDAMDELKDGIGLRAYGQKDPVVEYRIEGFDMFDSMIESIKEQLIGLLFHIQKKEQAKNEQVVKITSESSTDIDQIGGASENNKKTTSAPVKADKKVGRNEPCPCGSGRKYKQCCGK